MATLAAGGVMTIFFTPTYAKSYEFRMAKLGWPWTAVCRIESVARYRDTSAEIFGELRPVNIGECYISSAPLAADIAIFVAVLLFVTALFEWPIRRDEAEKLRHLARRAARNPPVDREVQPPSVVPDATDVPQQYLFSLNPVSKVILAVALVAVATANAIPQIVTTSTLERRYGWPLPMLVTNDFASRELRNDYLQSQASGLGGTSPQSWDADWSAVLLNFGVALVVILLFLAGTEMAMRAAKIRTRKRVAGKLT